VRNNIDTVSGCELARNEAKRDSAESKEAARSTNAIPENVDGDTVATACAITLPIASHTPSGFHIRKAIRASKDLEWLKRMALTMLLELEREKEMSEKLFLQELADGVNPPAS
jgi:hypothetical protein